MHEDFSRRGAERVSSDRVFGLLFAVVFGAIGLSPLVHASPPRYWMLVPALAFFVVAVVKPALLHPFNSVWSKFGLFLHRIVTPIVMAILFFGTVTPIAFILRALGKDPLRLKLDRASRTYWIARSPPGPSPESIKNQF